MVPKGRLELPLRRWSAAMSSLLDTVRSVNGTPRAVSMMRTLAQGAQSSPVEIVTGKRLTIWRRSYGSAAPLAAAGAGGRTGWALGAGRGRAEKLYLSVGGSGRRSTSRLGFGAGRRAVREADLAVRADDAINRLGLGTGAGQRQQQGCQQGGKQGLVHDRCSLGFDRS